MDPIDLFLIRGPQGVPTHSQYLRDQLPSGSQVGYDPSLHSAQAIQTLTSFISQKKITLVPGQNLIDLLWGSERDHHCHSRIKPFAYILLSLLDLIQQKNFRSSRSNISRLEQMQMQEQEQGNKEFSSQPH
jgi:hypothetical protein